MSRSASSPACLRQSVTTFEPGARLALTQGLVLRPRATAFLGSRPAAISTDGFDVLVQLVIAAITTEPWPISKLPCAVVTGRVAPRLPGAAWPPSLDQVSIAAASAPHLSPRIEPTARRHARRDALS